MDKRWDVIKDERMQWMETDRRKRKTWLIYEAQGYTQQYTPENAGARSVNLPRFQATSVTPKACEARSLGTRSQVRPMASCGPRTQRKKVSGGKHVPRRQSHTTPAKSRPDMPHELPRMGLIDVNGSNEEDQAPDSPGLASQTTGFQPAAGVNKRGRGSAHSRPYIIPRASCSTTQRDAAIDVDKWTATEALQTSRGLSRDSPPRPDGWPGLKPQPRDRDKTRRRERGSESRLPACRGNEKKRIR
ncbi:unnamed protein product [Lota lota]